jgi:hypothetical protein
MHHTDSGPAVRPRSHPAHGPHLAYGEGPEMPQIKHPGRNEYMVAWDRVTRRDVLRAIREYDRKGPGKFFSEYGFAPATTYELVWDECRYPPKAVLGAAYEFATGQQLSSGDFEGGKTGAVRVLGKLGFSVEKKLRPARSS